MSDSLFDNQNLIFLLLHIVGSFVMLSLPLTLYRNPPTKINPFYGFRTAAAKRNQDTWTVANNYFNTNITRLSIATVLLQIPLFFLLPLPYGLLVSLIIWGIGLVMLFFLTQNHLHQIFDEQGNRK